MKAYRVQVGVAREAGFIQAGVEVFTSPDAQTLGKVWGQLGLVERRICVIDPREKPGSLKPKETVTLLFTTKPNKDWASWLKKYDIQLVDKQDITKDGMETLLKSGFFGFKLDPEAATFVAEYFGDKDVSQFFSAVFVLDMTKPEGISLIDMNTLVDIWPGVNLKNARDITHTLGQPQSMRYLLKVPRSDSESIFGLWAYLEIVCKTRYTGYLHALHAFRNACDRLKFDYWEGLFLFLNYVYRMRSREKTGKEASWHSESYKTVNGATSSSPQRFILSQDLYPLLGLSYSDSGNMPE